MTCDLCRKVNDKDKIGDEIEVRYDDLSDAFWTKGTIVEIKEGSVTVSGNSEGSYKTENTRVACREARKTADGKCSACDAYWVEDPGWYPVKYIRKHYEG